MRLFSYSIAKQSFIDNPHKYLNQQKKPVKNKVSFRKNIIELGEELKADKRFHPSMLYYYNEHLPDACDIFLEIGAMNGNSAKMFNEFYFQKSEIYIIDFFTNLNPIDMVNCGFKPYPGDQGDIKLLDSMPNHIDVISEDGSHHSDDQIVTFKNLFIKKLNRGGVYCLEDIFCCKDEYWWRGKVTNYENTILSLFKNWNKGNKNLTSQWISKEESEVLNEMIDKIEICLERTNNNEQELIAFIWKK